ncbi:MAG: rhomboid family intramembrane serine protease [Phycisphaerae bacterium]|nr:rhomboid family intramembrane serine protease [Phycisphaerae bacterium]
MIPIRTNVWPQRTPYVNYALIVVNAVVFLVVAFAREDWRYHPLMLTPATWRVWQFLTYAFVHGSLLHILGNMYFLYIFGNNVNDRLGHLGYLCFYLAGAVFSGIGHVLHHPESLIPTVGASGAVAAVTGAYLVLFPQTLVTVLYWFIFLLGTVDIPALWFIGLKMILLDNYIARKAQIDPSIAYDAHLAGYAFGIGLTLFLLAVHILQGGPFDLWSMVVRWNRRRKYRDVLASGYDPFTGARPVQVKEVRRTPEQIEKEARVQALRAEITERTSQRNLPAAAQVYLDLMALDNGQVLPRQVLLDVANQLASEKRHADAALAYEQFLTHYGATEHAEQVMLMLGILYARYLARSGEAIRHLQRAAERLVDPSLQQQCRDELARLGA